MPIKLERDYIDETLKNLYTLLGIHEKLPLKEIYRWISKGEINKANKIITEHIGIPNPVDVEFVKGKELISSSLTEREKPSFIVAQIEIPPNLPVYGDPTLRNFPIRIKLNNELKHKSKEVIGCVLAHENTHLILDLLRYQGQYREVDIDLATIVLGLGDLIKKGRTYTETNYNFFYTQYRTETFGYLDEESFNYAYRKTKALYNSYNKHKSDILREIEKFKSFLKRTREIYNCFNENLNWITKNVTSLKIQPNDSQKFVAMQNFIFQQINFLDTLTQKNKIVDELSITVANRKIYYPSEEYGFITRINTIINNEFNNIKENYDLLKQWLKIQVKCIKFIPKISTIITLVRN
ncbi:MAG: hypothetical protein NC827_10020 [Candidatus Omnitrophica bacterium]|nr:hypothetical protein [Candidatus Omnitrophota bacterium]